MRTVIAASILGLGALMGTASAQAHEANCQVGQPRAADARWERDEHANLDVLLLTRDNRLACVSERRPGRAQQIVNIVGLNTDTQVVSVDYRVQDGKLYGLGNAGGVYLLDSATGVATFVNRLSVALEGERVAMDFNPVADRLRVVSSAGQNLRHNVNPGGVTLVDGGLNYTAGTLAQGVVAAAYTNNDLSAATPATTGTTLFVLDATQDQVVLQSPPNAGGLVATGKLGVDTTTFAGLDLYSTVRDNVTVRNVAVAALTAPDGSAMLYRVDVLTGAAKATGKLPSSLSVADIAVPLYQD